MYNFENERQQNGWHDHVINVKPVTDLANVSQCRIIQDLAKNGFEAFPVTGVRDKKQAKHGHGSAEKQC